MPEELAAEKTARKEHHREYQRNYLREWQRKKKHREKHHQRIGVTIKHRPRKGGLREIVSRFFYAQD
jgi:hypothetical protein